MKEATFGQLLKEIIGGTPAEVGIKLILSGVALLWDNLAVIGASVFLYFILLVVDAVMGAMLSKDKFNFSFFIRGPLKKFSLTAGMLFVGSIVDSMIPNMMWIPDTPLFIAVASFVGITTMLDVARKYGALTGSKLILWLEERLGRYIQTKDKE